MTLISRTFCVVFTLLLWFSQVPTESAFITPLIEVNKWEVVLQDTEYQPWTQPVRCAYDELHFRVSFNLPKELKQNRKSKTNMMLQLLRRDDHASTQFSPVYTSDFLATATSTEANNEIGYDYEYSIDRLVGEKDDAFNEKGEGNNNESIVKDLQCEFDREFCIPKIIGINLPNALSQDETMKENHTIILQFENPTNRPSVKTKEEIERFIVFTEYIADAMSGRWKNPRTLEIRILKLDESRVKVLPILMKALEETSLRLTFADDTNTEPEAIEMTRFMGEARYRVGLPGVYHFILSDKASSSTTVPGRHRYIHIESPAFTVNACHPSATVISHDIPLLPMKPTSEKVNVTAPSYELKGMISHGTKEGLILPNSTIQMYEIGTWSINFWTFLTQDSTGNFRTLFFKGNGSGDHRTPSAWFKPEDRRLALRVSTTASMDVGLDSKSAILLNKWTHLGFSFLNCSTGINEQMSQVRNTTECMRGNNFGGRRWFYKISFFLNGILDKDVLVYAPVLPNDGPLHFGKGPWTDGMQGFVSNLRIYPVALSPKEHRTAYLDEKENHMNFDTTILASSNEVRAIAEKPTNQISYLRQVFTLRESGSSLVAINVGKEAYQNALDSSAAACKVPDHVWDLLLESAEHHYPPALRDVGQAYLYGYLKLPYNSECEADPSNSGTSVKDLGLKVELNLEKARKFLELAFINGQLDAGKPLALALRIASTLPPSSNEDKEKIEDLMCYELGLYHLAAAGGRQDAFAIIARRYFLAANLHTDEMKKLDVNAKELAAYHYYHAAMDASVSYHEHGKQPLFEMNRLYDGLTQDLTKGQLGDDDELIQYQKMRADKDGDVEAMAAMGDLYYWGARGLPRDHEQAHYYFKKASIAGHTSSQAALAGMLLKGEGAPQDNKTAIEWYKKAAEKNHTRALNGLGFVHFYGSGGMEENKTLALTFFERAAANAEDGDSIFNAGYCHALGLGTVPNISHAMTYYDTSARKFGHFDSIMEMGKLYMTGSTCHQVQRDPSKALAYLKAAAEAGSWAKCVRQGFELYLAHDYSRAAVRYHEASEYGYPVAISNLAYLYDTQLLMKDHVGSEKRALSYLMKSAQARTDKEVLTRIGDYHYYGLAGLNPNPKEALRWYSRASSEGVGIGAYNVGHMYEYGLGGIEKNLERAQRYYHRVLELSFSSKEVKYETLAVVYLALLRLKAHRWLEQIHWLSRESNSSSDKSKPAYDA